MAIKINKSENKLLNLPGRMSCEIVAGSAVGSNISVRVVEIPAGVQKSKRSLHYHPNTDECIYVLEGTGRTETINKSFDLQEGDSIIVSAGEKHKTLNISFSHFWPKFRVLRGFRKIREAISLNFALFRANPS